MQRAIEGRLQKLEQDAGEPEVKITVCWCENPAPAEEGTLVVTWEDPKNEDCTESPAE